MNRKKIKKLISSTISVIYIANSSPVFALDGQTKEDILSEENSIIETTDTNNENINVDYIEDKELDVPQIEDTTTENTNDTEIIEDVKDEENIEIENTNKTEDSIIDTSNSSNKIDNININTNTNTTEENKKVTESSEIIENADKNSKISIQTIELSPTIYKPTINYSNGYVSIEDNGVVSDIQDITETFNNPNSLSFNFSNSDWTISSGVMSSKKIGNSQSTTNTIVLNLDANAEITIKARVSSEERFDWGLININGENIFKQSGSNINFTTITHKLTKGVNTIEFTYKKDGSGTSGLDAMFIDEIKLSSEVFQPNSDRIEYRINGGQWETYSQPFECEEGSSIECRSVYNSNYSDIVSTNLNSANIPDENLYNALKNILNKNENSTTIFIDDLKSLSGTLDLSNKNISNLSGLEVATNITGLNLSGNPISDISVIENMPQLESLTAQNINITDITSIINTPSLQTIDLTSDIIYTETDLVNIAAMPNLINLTAKFNAPNTILNIGSDSFSKAQYLNLNGSNFKEVNIIDNNSLVTFYCNSSKLENFNALNSNLLTTISLPSSKLNNFIVDNMPSLSYVSIYESILNNISITNCPKFDSLSANKLTNDSLLLENLHNDTMISLTIDNSILNNVTLNTITSPNSSFNSSNVTAKNLTIKNSPFVNGNFYNSEFDNFNVNENSTINYINANNLNIKNILDLTGLTFKNLNGDGIHAANIIIEDCATAEYISLDKVVSQSAYINNCPKVTIVTFSDAAIDNISVKNMDSVSTIYTKGMNCLNFSVENCISMEGMYNVPKASIKNLRLVNLPNLSGRDFSESNIETVLIEGCNSLDNLNLANNHIKDISGISSLTSLPALDISGNHITDISSLKNMTNLNPGNITASNQTIALEDILSKAGTISITSPTIIDYNGDTLTGTVKSNIEAKTKIKNDLILGEFEEGLFDTNIEFISDSIDYSLTASQKITVDGTAPSISLTQDNKDWTNGTTSIRIEATDSLSGVDYIKLPNGDIIHDSTFEFEVSQNGDFEFEAVDLVGNSIKKTITISNIDTIAPIVKTSVTYNDDNTEAILKIEATDSLSGILSITLPDGQVVNSDSTSFTINKNGDFIIAVSDIVGNIYTETIKIDSIKDKIVPDDNTDEDNTDTDKDNTNNATDNVLDNNNNNNSPNDDNKNDTSNNIDKIPNSSGLGVFAPVVAMMSLAIGAISFKKKK